MADLVVAEVADNGVLCFSWNSQVASGAFSGGVKITMPADQLRSVVASQSERPSGLRGTSNSVQILEGFTSIKTLELASSGFTGFQVWASLTDVQNALSVKVDTMGSVDLKSGGLKSLEVHRGTVSADVDGSVDNLDVNGSSGDSTFVYLTASGGIKNGSVDTVDGYGAALEANSTVTGRLTAAGYADVVLPSCANVSTSGEAACTEEATNEGREVDTSRRPATRQRTHMCAVSAYDDSTCSGTISGPTLSASLAVLSAVATSFMV